MTLVLLSGYERICDMKTAYNPRMNNISGLPGSSDNDVNLFITWAYLDSITRKVPGYSGGDNSFDDFVKDIKQFQK